MDTSIFSQVFSLEQLRSEEGEGVFGVKINFQAAVFEGHFPNRPVMPGVFMMELVRRATEYLLGFKLQMAGSRSVKFIHVVEPSTDQPMVLTIKFTRSPGETYLVNAMLSSSKRVYFKERAEFKIHPAA